MKMKKVLLLTILAGALGGTLPVDTAAQTIATKQSRAEFRRRFEDHLRRVDRHIEITPRHGGGVSSGLVIVFGHPVAPPYKIEFVDYRLTVNGVVVQPSPIEQRERGGDAKSSTPGEIAFAKKLSSLMNSAQGMYRNKIANNNESSAQKEVLDYVKRQDIVSDAKWTSAKSMDVMVKADSTNSFRMVIQFTKTAPEKKPPHDIAANSTRNQGRYVNAIEAQLRRGECIFFSTNGGESNCSGLFRRPDQFLKHIRLIMSNQKLSDNEKLNHVRKVVNGNLVPALDIMSNYHSTEWATKAR